MSDDSDDRHNKIVIQNVYQNIQNTQNNQNNCQDAQENIRIDDDDNDNREIIIQLQRFTASGISMLNLLQTVCQRQKDEDLNAAERKSKNKFMLSSQECIDRMKDDTEEFEYTRFIKKAFYVLNKEEQCAQLKNKDPNLFNIRDENNKIVTILPGLDLKFGYKFLTDDEKKQFWQYMHLFASSVFNMIKEKNENKFNRFEHIKSTLKIMETELAKTGIMFNDQIFNPFLGVGENMNEYGVNEMFTNGELPKQHVVSIESVLNMLGVDKMFDEQKLNEELKGIGDEQINEATERIVGLLGANDNPEVKEVCNQLIQDIVLNFKENGISNVGETLRKVAENAKNNIEINKMRKTADSMKYFMAHSQEKMNDLKDANGNSIGQQLMNNLAVPLNMMNMMNRKQNNNDNSPNANAQ